MAKLLQQNPNIAQVKFVWLRFTLIFTSGACQEDSGWTSTGWGELSLKSCLSNRHHTRPHTLRPLAFLPSWPMRNKSSPPPLPILLLPLVCKSCSKTKIAKLTISFLNPGACSLVSHNGHPCDPGLAYSPATGTCEWPDTLIEQGCNPEGNT